MTKYKMIAIDLDDTLLKDDLTISKKTRETVIEAQKRGIKVVIATGRPPKACKAILEELKTGEFNSLLISYNGAMIIDLHDNTVLQSICISKESVYRLFELSQKEDTYIQTYMKDSIITPLNNKYTEIEKNITGMECIETKDFCRYVDTDVVKVIIMQEPEYLKQAALRIAPFVPDTLHMFFSKPFFLEFVNKAVDKAAGVRFAAKKLNIPMSEVIAIGDSGNDIGMIRQAGLGVAMGNASEEIKKEARFVTKSNNEDGVAEVILRYCLNTRTSVPPSLNNKAHTQKSASE